MTSTKKPAFKEGQKVVHTKRYGTGKIVDIRVLGNGTWITVNFGDKKTPLIKVVRPGTLRKG